jgi:hypothetical protein
LLNVARVARVARVVVAVIAAALVVAIAVTLIALVAVALIALIAVALIALVAVAVAVAVTIALIALAVVVAGAIAWLLIGVVDVNPIVDFANRVDEAVDGVFSLTSSFCVSAYTFWPRALHLSKMAISCANGEREEGGGRRTLFPHLMLEGVVVAL